MDKVEQEIKELIVSALQLGDVTPGEIDSEIPLFGTDGGLGLDSIDALELGVALRKRFGLTIKSVNDDVKQHFRSVRSLAAFVRTQTGGQAI